MKDMKFFIYIVILIAHLFPAQLLGNNDTKPLVTIYGKAKFENNVITLQIFNDSDEDAYVLDCYFMQGLSNSKWFYRWDKRKNLLKLSFAPIVWHLFLSGSGGLRIPDTYIKDKVLNSSQGSIWANLSFDTIPAHKSKKFHIVTQNFKHIKNVLIDDYDSISRYDIAHPKWARFTRLIQAQKPLWYIELAIYPSIRYLDRKSEFVEEKLYEQLFGYIPLLIKIDFE